MSKLTSGPRLVKLQKKGWTKAIWYIRYRKNNNKTEVSTGTSSRAEADQFFQQQWLPEYYRKQEKSLKLRDPNTVLIEDCLINYAEEHAYKTNSPQRIGYAIKALSEYWANKMVDDVDEDTCDEYLISRDVSDSTVRRELGVLRASFKHAERKKRLTHVPHVYLPAEHEGKDRWLTRPEMARLLWYSRTIYSRTYLPLFILLGLYTAARKSAILELTWQQVDFKNNRIDFNPKGRKKTNKGRPIIPMQRHLRTFLRLAYERRGTCEFVVNNGKPILDIKKGFAGAVQRADLKDVTPHTLRHTAATWMAQQGVSMFVIAQYLGQTNERTTTIYAHHHPDYLKDTERAFG